MSITDTAAPASPYLNPTELLILRAAANLLDTASERMFMQALTDARNTADALRVGRMRGEMSAANRALLHALAVLEVDAEGREADALPAVDLNLAASLDAVAGPDDE